MENTYNPHYKKLYDQGYTFGQNPVFIDFEDITAVAPRYNNDAFLSGFNLGRRDYELWNGKLSKGVPEIVLTGKLLEEIRVTGEIGMDLETKGFSQHQMTFVRDAYEKGFRQYEPNRDISLYCELAINGISL